MAFPEGVACYQSDLLKGVPLYHHVFLMIIRDNHISYLKIFFFHSLKYHDSHVHNDASVIEPTGAVDDCAASRHGYSIIRRSCPFTKLLFEMPHAHHYNRIRVCISHFFWSHRHYFTKHTHSNFLSKNFVRRTFSALTNEQMLRGGPSVVLKMPCICYFLSHKKQIKGVVIPSIKKIDVLKYYIVPFP